MSIDVMKQALTALERGETQLRYEAITTLRAAIEQAQEPVECMCGICKLGKREWQGLTDEEVSEILDREIGFNSCFGPETDFARAIEARLKENNT